MVAPVPIVVEDVVPAVGGRGHAHVGRGAVGVCKHVAAASVNGKCQPQRSPKTRNSCVIIIVRAKMELEKRPKTLCFRKDAF